MNLLMDYFENILKSDWLAIAGTIASLLGLSIAIFSLFDYAQKKTVKNSIREDENLYLKRMIEYLKNINIQSQFNERFYIEREFRLNETYMPRAFFITKHQSIFSQMGISGANQFTSNTTYGYYTTDIFGEAKSRSAPIVILGDPGSGKTVSSRQLTIKIARKSGRTNNPNRLIPVFISLTGYTDINENGQPVSFYNYVLNILQNRGSNSIALPSSFLKNNFDKYLDAGRIFFVLDSLDEMPPHLFRERCNELNQFFTKHSNNRFIITCRSNDFSGNIVGSIAYLDKLKPKDIKKFISKRRHLFKKWNVNQIFKMITAPSFKLSSVINNPFYLNLILYFAELKGELPQNFPLLYKVIFMDWAKREISKASSKGQKLAVDSENQANKLISNLSEIAFFISNSAGFGTYIETSKLEELYISAKKDPNHIKNAISLGINGKIFELDKSNKQIRFFHHKFQEYFSAVFLNTALSNNWILFDEFPSICNNIWWEEVTAITVSISDNPQEIINSLINNATDGGDKRHYSLVLQRNFWLVGRCLRFLPISGNQELWKKVDEFIQKNEIILKDESTSFQVSFDCLKSLGELENENAVRILSEFLTHDNRIFREIAFSGLSNTAYGRVYISQNINRIAIDIYLKNYYGGREGKLSDNIRNILFPSFQIRALLLFYLIISIVARSYLIILTLSLAIFSFSLIFKNLYGLIFFMLLIFFQIRSAISTKIPIFKGRLPKIIFFLKTFSQILFLFLTYLAVKWDLLLPPFLPFITFLFIIVVLIFGHYTMVSLINSIFHLIYFINGDILKKHVSIRSSALKIVRKIPSIIKRSIRAASRSAITLDFNEENIKKRSVAVGLTSPADYVGNQLQSIQSIPQLLNELKGSQFAGKEVKIFEEIQNKERQILQENSSPNIIDLSKLIGEM